MTHKLRIGIQGDRGSFSEEALVVIAQKHGIAQFETVYCHNTKSVLSDLRDGKIDRGVFAIYNSQSKLVDETATVLGHYMFDVVDYVTLPIEHCLMALTGIDIAQIAQIMGHGEAIAQCKATLADKFADKEIIVGNGNLMDGAAVGAALSSGDLRKTVAALGSKSIAKYYNLQIIAQNLQDDPQNTTTFLFVASL